MTLAQQLLDAQVAWVLADLQGERLATTVARAVDAGLAAATDRPLSDLVAPDDVKPVVRRLVATVPASTGAGALVRRTASLVHAGPEERFSADQLLTREQVEALVGEVLHSSRLAEKTLDELAQSPLMATVASRFVARIVGEVLQANRAVAEKVPGLTGLMSFGTATASRMMGGADKQFEALVGGATGKGATFAARRLNKIVLESLQDPTTRAAVMQVWDMYADKPLPPPSEYVDEADAQHFAETVHEAVATAAASEPVGQLLDGLVDGFFAEYGDHPVPTLMEELALSRDDLVTDVTAFLSTAVGSLAADDVLESLVRTLLAPFWESPEVAALLER